MLVPLFKRQRTDDAAPLRFVMQGVGFTQFGGLWPSLQLELHERGLVSCNNGPLHGSWNQNGNDLLLVFHYAADPNKVKTMRFQKINCTECWLQIDCNPEWQSVLMPAVESSA